MQLVGHGPQRNISQNRYAPLSGKNAQLVSRAHQLRQQANSVIADLTQAPPKRVALLDTAEAGRNLLSNVDSGSIGSDQFPNAVATLKNGQVLSFSAGTDTRMLSYLRQNAETTGIRAALVGVVGGLGAGTAMLAVSMQSAATAVGLSDKTAERLTTTFRPVISTLQNSFERLSTGAARETVTIQGPGGARESYQFSENGTLCVLFEPAEGPVG